LQPYIHDVRAMSACAPTADVSCNAADDATGQEQKSSRRRADYTWFRNLDDHSAS
jgi:hypothetical protein